MPLDTMTLGGLAVAVGVVVDDAIIDVENIIRRLRENARNAHPKSALEVIRDASLEVRASVLYATFVVVAVFIPVFALSGLQGRFFLPLAFAFVLAVAASLLTALTVVPALSLLFLHGTSPHQEPAYVRFIKEVHGRILQKVCRWPLVISGFGFIARGTHLLETGIPSLRTFTPVQGRSLRASGIWHPRKFTRGNHAIWKNRQ